MSGETLLMPALCDDPAVPTRETLLDRAAMADRFAERWPDVDRSRVSLVKVKYRVGENLRVLYQVPVAGDDLLVAARTTSPGATASPTAAPAPSDPSRFTDDTLGARLWTVRGDRRLRHVDDLLDGTAAVRTQVPRRWVRTHVVGYAPEKSLVVACLDSTGAPVAFAKMYEDGPTAARAWSVHRAISAQAGMGGHLRVAGPLGLDEARAIVFTDVVRGIRLSDVDPARMVGHLHTLGRTLARLHDLPCGPEVGPFRRTSAASLATAARIVARARPDCAARAHAVVEALGMGPSPLPASLLHGDVHLKNALVDDGRLTLIDLDQAATGSPAIDLGSFLALLRTLTRTRTLTADAEATWRAGFLGGYATVRPVPDHDELAWATAAALLGERALRAIGRVRYPVLARLDVLLEDAWALAREAGAA